MAGSTHSLYGLYSRPWPRPSFTTISSRAVSRVAFANVRAHEGCRLSSAS